MVDGADTPGEGAPEPAKEAIAHPARLIRIASMVRNMLEEVRQAPLDVAARRRLREIHDRSVIALRDMLSPDLERELADMVLPFSSAAPSEPELRIAQAQLVGWLEGLFHGIQATLFTQQAAAQAQLEEMRRRRGLPSGTPPGSGPERTGYL
ncbi:MAG: proteasome activator [Acidimicrobiia bacterium]